MSRSSCTASQLLALSVVLILSALPLRAQSSLESQTEKPQEGAQSPAKGGSGTAGVFPPVMDASHRPITVGGTVETGPFVFEDIAAKAGLT